MRTVPSLYVNRGRRSDSRKLSQRSCARMLGAVSLNRRRAARPHGTITAQRGTAKGLISEMGHSRRFFHVRVMSAYPPVATGQRTSLDVSNVPVMDIDAAVCRGNRYPQ